MTIDPSIFRDYDIRAKVPSQLDQKGIKRLALTITHYFKPKSLQVGHDMRISSPKFHKIFINTFINCGVNVVDLGLIATDMLYFASGKYPEDLAIIISASHNPPEYNGLKIVKKGAIAVSGQTGIYDLKKIALSKKDLSLKSNHLGQLTHRDILPSWVKHALSFVKTNKIKPLKAVIDAGNGMAGYFMPAFEKKLPLKTSHLFYKLDGTFPNHTPNPIKPENLKDVIKKVKSSQADIGLAFDGDGDRVSLIDETGQIISGTVMTAILAETLLKKHPKNTILYNAIVGRIVPEVIKKNHGRPLRVKVGHTLIKAAMRKKNALFCGEHSGHFYFRQNFYADSAIIAALLVLELMSEKEVKLSQLRKKYDVYPRSGEINFEVKDKKTIMKKLESLYKKSAKSIDWLDGISLWFDNWWVNIRPSNTESLLRLNLEANDKKLLNNKVKEFINLIKSLGGKIKK